MIRNTGFKLSFSISFLIAILFHLVILIFVKKNSVDFSASHFNHNISRPLKIDRIELISSHDLEKMKKVGIKNGVKKDYIQPDMQKIERPKPALQQGLSLGSLALDLPIPKESPKTNPNEKTNLKNERSGRNSPDSIARPISDDNKGHIYYNPKKEKKIPRDRDQDNLKQEAFKNSPVNPSNSLAKKMSNFEIRYERPEGISEDELNSDEKAYYSFFKRSYANYLEKLYATYEKMSVERPGLDKDFSNSHLLIGKIDYDEKGNIIMVKILKSSESDDVHAFFEETLKQLKLPNPPKSFIKNKKQFTTYYQIQIN